MTIHFDGNVDPQKGFTKSQKEVLAKYKTPEVDIGQLLGKRKDDNSIDLQQAIIKNNDLVENGKLKIPTAEELKEFNNIKPKAKSLDYQPFLNPETGKYVMQAPDGGLEDVPNDTGYAPPGMKPNPLYRPDSDLPEFVPLNQELPDTYYN